MGRPRWAAGRPRTGPYCFLPGSSRKPNAAGLSGWCRSRSSPSPWMEPLPLGLGLCSQNMLGLPACWLGPVASSLLLKEQQHVLLVPAATLLRHHWKWIENWPDSEDETAPRPGLDRRRTQAFGQSSLWLLWRAERTWRQVAETEVEHPSHERHTMVWWTGEV